MANSYFKYNDPIQILLRKGTSDDPYVDKIESHLIKNNIIVLDELPDEFFHVKIDGYTEIYEGFPKENEFIVSYYNGIATFHESQNGKTVLNVIYKGRGCVLYPAQRIYAHNDNPNVVDTLQTVIDHGVSVINAVEHALDGHGIVASVSSSSGDLVISGSASNPDLSLNATLKNSLNTKSSVSFVSNGVLSINGVNTTIYAHPSGAGNNHIPSGGASGNYLAWTSSGVAIWSTLKWADIVNKPTTLSGYGITDVISTKLGGNIEGTLSVNGHTVYHEGNLLNATKTSDGLMSKKDKEKFDGLSEKANNVTNPTLSFEGNLLTLGLDIDGNTYKANTTINVSSGGGSGGSSYAVGKDAPTNPSKNLVWFVTTENNGGSNSGSSYVGEDAPSNPSTNLVWFVLANK